MDFILQDTLQERLDQLKLLLENCEKEKYPVHENYVNNHFHTFYSFSPWSPSGAIWAAKTAGLRAAGIMDHDSISGAEEFIKAGELTGIAATIGCECRADTAGTPLDGRRINNPDQDSNIYMAIRGIPHNKIREVKSFFAPFQKERNVKNKVMVENLNRRTSENYLKINFEMDVLPLSHYQEGGTVTERHICYALAHKVLTAFPERNKIISFLKEKLELNLREKEETLLKQKDNSFLEYDLLNVLKAGLVESFYVDANTACPNVLNAVDFSIKIGAIPTYIYLGDVRDSGTGDIKDRKFEDDFLESLFEELKVIGFQAVDYIPSRNTGAQLKRVRSLCDEAGFLQICGEDNNSPRKSLFYDTAALPEFSNLVDTTWALIGHEKEVAENINRGFFSHETINRFPDLNERISAFKQIGLQAHAAVKQR